MGVNSDSDPKHIVRNHGRRSFLIGAGAVLITACTDADQSEPVDATTSTSFTTNSSTEPPSSPATEATMAENGEVGSDPGVLTPAMFDALAVCTLTSAAPAGPFPTNSPLDRRAIHEGYIGHPLRLGIRVVDQNCQPVPGAKVEVWHTDATGDYSEYEDGGDGKDEGEGSTFCRGIQTADDNGILEFQTIYPGWYPGRAVHIHATAYFGDEKALTSQLYFDESYTETVYSTGEYSQFGLPDTSWADDGIADDPSSDGSIIDLSETQVGVGAGTLGLINLGVDI